MRPRVGLFVRHLSTGIVGTVERVYAAGEHPSATCEVVRLSTGDELVLSEDGFELIGGEEAAALYRRSVAVMTIVVASVRQIAATFLRGRPASVAEDKRLVDSVLRSALSEAIRGPSQIDL